MLELLGVVDNSELDRPEWVHDWEHIRVERHPVAESSGCGPRDRLPRCNSAEFLKVYPIYRVQSDV